MIKEITCQFGQNTYKERAQLQLDMWLIGKSIHNNVDDECCPDFSCCNKKMKTSKKIREEFYNAEIDSDIRTKLLIKFLSEALQKHGYEVETN